MEESAIPYCIVAAKDRIEKEKKNYQSGRYEKCRCKLSMDTLLFYSGTDQDPLAYWRCINCVTDRQVRNAIVDGKPKLGASKISSASDFDGFDSLHDYQKRYVIQTLDPLFRTASQKIEEESEKKKRKIEEESEKKKRKIEEESEKKKHKIEEESEKKRQRNECTEATDFFEGFLQFARQELLRSDSFVAFLNQEWDYRTSISEIHRLKVALTEKDAEIQRLKVILTEKDDEILNRTRTADNKFQLIRDFLHNI